MTVILDLVFEYPVCSVCDDDGDMNYDADPLLDDTETCQGCKAQLLPQLICEHTEESPGPCCTDLCCPRLHGDDGDLGEAA